MRILGQCSHHDLIEMSVLIFKKWNKPSGMDKPPELTDLNPKYSKTEEMAFGVITLLAIHSKPEVLSGIKEVLAWGDNEGIKSFEYKTLSNVDPEMGQSLKELCRKGG